MKYEDAAKEAGTQKQPARALAVKAIGASLLGLGLITLSAQANETCITEGAEVVDYVVSAPVVGQEAGLAGDLFLEVDYQATLEKLPDDKRAEAQRLVTAIENAEQALMSSENQSMETVTDLQALDQRLEVILAQAGVELQEVDLLKKLPEATQLKALLLWRDIQNNNWADEKVLEQKVQALDNIIEQVQ